MNSIGERFRLTTFGESHGQAMGGIIDGFPSGVKIDLGRVQDMLDKRRTGQSNLTSMRRESDIPEILSGISPEGLSLGTPIGFIFRNSDARSEDYSELENHCRPNHADYVYEKKYGLRDARGGGRSSARETVNWVMGGAMAREWLINEGISVEARILAIGSAGYDDPFLSLRENPIDGELPCDEEIENRMLEEVSRAKENRDSVGGMVGCVIKGVKAGLGEPVFDKLQGRLAAAMMGLNAAKSFEYGLGKEAASKKGSESLDLFADGFEPLPMLTNRGGGILGGISTGMPIYFSVAFKPTPTISRPLPMPDRDGRIEVVTARGRHDPCVALRTPVIIEALAWLVLADFYRL